MIIIRAEHGLVSHRICINIFAGHDRSLTCGRAQANEARYGVLMRATDEGLRLRVNPVKELRSLRTGRTVLKARTLVPGENPLAGVKGELFDLSADIRLDQAAQIDFKLRGVAVVYDAKAQELSCEGKRALLKLVNGCIRLRMFVDRTSIDIFGNAGSLYMPMGVIVPHDNLSLEISAQGGAARINSLEVYRLKSSWQR